MYMRRKEREERPIKLGMFYYPRHIKIMMSLLSDVEILAGMDIQLDPSEL